jgi:hypothetical protein
MAVGHHSGTTQGVRCATRALKNADYLRTNAPTLVATDEDAEGFGTGVPEDVLQRLHRLSHDSPEARRHAGLPDFLREHPVPGPGLAARGPLFNGTLHFVRVTFQAGGQQIAIPPADMQMMLQYAQRAIVPIAEYASQYGATHINVAPNILSYAVNLHGHAYNDATLKRWVNDIAAKNNIPNTDAIVIPSPQGLTAPNVGGNSGYHGLAHLPYTVFGVFATNLALNDPPDVYAMVVSHEIAELVVDPRVDHANPEVCDPCDLNCGGQNLNRAFFDAANTYLGTRASLPPPFAYSYYICAVVKPAGAADCPAPSGDCVYSPT